MKTSPLTAADHELVKEARRTISRLYKENKHHVSASLRTGDDTIVSAVHIEADIGRVTVCAEAIAIGSAIAQGKSDFHTIVAVRQPHPDEGKTEQKVVSPCGMCRELISDYSPECFVILEMERGLVKTKIEELIPLKYTR